MLVRYTVKHFLHCALMVSFITAFEVASGAIRSPRSKFPVSNAFETYGVLGSFILYLLRFSSFLALPHVLLNFAGLVFYDTFPGKVRVKQTSKRAPFICVRIVTRGDYPQLVKNNVRWNLSKCIRAGWENFMIEVVTEVPMVLPNDRRIYQTVVPSWYQTSTGALFKSRALQYCLEDYVNVLSSNDYIVHLDEETLLSENAAKGIMNFVIDGSHHFGQGLITYAKPKVVNWITTLADSFRVAEDMGKLRAQFYLFGKPLLSWKGSYVVTQFSAERHVSYDNGLEGSIAEDSYFAMKAMKEGYTFTFIEGEMFEQSPFTLSDLIQQRKRWLQGLLPVVHSKRLPWRAKIFLAISCYAWITAPLSTSNFVLAALYPIPCPIVIDILVAFMGSFSIYMYIFGVIKSFSLRRLGVIPYLLCIFGAVATIPINIIVENIAVIWGIFGKKNQFYVVKKQIKPQNHRRSFSV